MANRRLDRIAALHGARLRECVLREEDHLGLQTLDAYGAYDDDASSKLVALFAEHDPSPQHRYTQWLVRTYIADGFLVEDLVQATETLELFHANRRHLAVPQRDIGAYDTLSALWKAVAPFSQTRSNRAECRAERDAARSETVILHEGKDGLTIAVPMTRRAAIWWGRGTRWCTAASKDNAFQQYHQTGPLIVIVMPGGRKLQMWAVKESCSFEVRDDADARIGKRSIDDDEARALLPLLRWASGFVHPSKTLALVPDSVLRDEHILDCYRAYAAGSSRRSHFVDLISCRHDPRMFDVLGDTAIAEMFALGVLELGDVPAVRRTSTIMAAALDASDSGLTKGWHPRDVPVAMLLDRPWLLSRAVAQDPTLLKDIPDGLIDGAMCTRAVQTLPEYYHHVPERFRDHALLLLAAQGGADVGTVTDLAGQEDVILASFRCGRLKMSLAGEGTVDPDTIRQRIAASAPPHSLAETVSGDWRHRRFPPGYETPALAEQACLSANADPALVEDPLRTTVIDVMELVASIPAASLVYSAVAGTLSRLSPHLIMPPDIDESLVGQPGTPPVLPAVFARRRLLFQRLLAASPENLDRAIDIVPSAVSVLPAELLTKERVIRALRGDIAVLESLRVRFETRKDIPDFTRMTDVIDAAVRDARVVRNRVILDAASDDIICDLICRAGMTYSCLSPGRVTPEMFRKVIEVNPLAAYGFPDLMTPEMSALVEQNERTGARQEWKIDVLDDIRTCLEAETDRSWGRNQSPHDTGPYNVC